MARISTFRLGKFDPIRITGRRAADQPDRVVVEFAQSTGNVAKAVMDEAEFEALTVQVRDSKPTPSPPPPPPPVAGHRWFADDSIWNVPARQKGAVTVNPYPNAFTSYDPGLVLGGGPGGSSSHDAGYAKPIYQATSAHPQNVTIIQSEPTWVSAKSGVRVQPGELVPNIPEAKPATGSDGHLEIITADGEWGYQMWRAGRDASGNYTCTDASKWNLKTGSGVQLTTGSAGGRGSGTPIFGTTLTPNDCSVIVDHAVGITIPTVSSSYIYPPATKSDGSGGSDQVKYGMLFVLRSDYPETGFAPGPRAIVKGLKTYGAYVVDQGASFEIDTCGDFGIASKAAWQALGINRDCLLALRPSDFLLVQ